MNKIKLWLGLVPIAVICMLTALLTGELSGSFSTLPVSVVNKSENKTTGSQKKVPSLVDVHYNPKQLSSTSTNNVVSKISKPNSVRELESEPALEILPPPKLDKNTRPTSKQYQAYLKELNSVPLPKGRLVIQVNSEAGVALANRYRELRREAKRRPVRSFSPNGQRQPTNSRQIAMESFVAKNDSTSTSTTISTSPRTTVLSSSRPPDTSQSSTPTTTRSTLGRYYDPAYRPSVGNHYVKSYRRRDGTFVQGHHKTNSDDSFWNNWSSKGNSNPYTGSTGTRRPSSSYSGGSTYVRGYHRSNGSYVRGHYRRK